MDDNLINEGEKFSYEDLSPEELERVEDEEDIKNEKRKGIGNLSGEEYVALYQELHRNPKRFPGYSLSAYADEIAEMVIQYSAKTLLDYGCGKGYQYLSRRVHEKWGAILPTCYDPGVSYLDKLPLKGTKFDGVICTDVLEHIPRQDVKKFLKVLFDYADKFVFLTVATFPAEKELPNGENCHITVRPIAWWRELIVKAAGDTPYKLMVNSKREPSINQQD